MDALYSVYRQSRHRPAAYTGLPAMRGDGKLRSLKGGVEKHYINRRNVLTKSHEDWQGLRRRLPFEPSAKNIENFFSEDQMKTTCDRERTLTIQTDRQTDQQADRQTLSSLQYIGP
ncbi:hypothetical protein DPMN_091370 [Dreissena polymorpha]|uniref:Uncharacterized protein n=1 Tax=Dreissena polymorpha TaxID=45954 RepID=A0A9D4R0N3_DREPO|nr:hypothetical protein DPMN_091370 [Dreissena polymorpha]